MSGPDLPRLAVLAGPEESLSPTDVARSADGLASYWFLLDGGDTSAEAEVLRRVASALAPTAVAEFTDLAACRAAIRRNGADAVTTFTDKFCPVAAWLNAEVNGATAPLPPWGRKDLQRRMLREAGLSRVQSARMDGEDSLRAFVRAAGLPVVVKPVGSGLRLGHSHRAGAGGAVAVHRALGGLRRGQRLLHACLHRADPGHPAT